MFIRPTIPWTDSTGAVDSLAEYEVRAHGEHFIRGFLLDEERRTDAGQLVTWDLVMFGPHEYRWHRNDWEEGGYTKANYRCPASSPSGRP